MGSYGKNFSIPGRGVPVARRGKCPSCQRNQYQYLHKTEHGGQQYPPRCRPCLDQFLTICAEADAEDREASCNPDPKYTKAEILEKFVL